MTSSPTHDDDRLISVQAWQALVRRLLGMTHGGGELRCNLLTEWSGNVRWAHNRITTSGDLRDNTLTLGRSVDSPGQFVQLNQWDDAALLTAMTYLEQANQLYQRRSLEAWTTPPFRAADYLHPTLWFDPTVTLDGTQRANVAQQAIAPAAQAGMVSAGYLEVAGSGVAVARPVLQMDLYQPQTEAQYSLTVRDPQGTGSGWAGVSWNDWRRIDTTTLNAIALDKCLTSRHPVAIEPGRYTAILEPQAVYDLTRVLVENHFYLDWGNAVLFSDHPFHDGQQRSKTKLGEPIMDPRLTIRADPMDPDLGFVPFDEDGEPYRPVIWVDHGVLAHLSYAGASGHVGLLNSGAFRLEGTGVPTTKEEMIATTQRGILVTRFYKVAVVDRSSVLEAGFTRDGLWLIEDGRVTKAIKNFRFAESPLIMLNQVEQIGPAQRVFCPGHAAVVPPLKVRDFNFTYLSDAI